jgi:hypothetical protein
MKQRMTLKQRMALTPGFNIEKRTFCTIGLPKSGKGRPRVEVGDTWNFLKVVEFARSPSFIGRGARCVCVCGKEKVYPLSRIKSGILISCGCYKTTTNVGKKLGRWRPTKYKTPEDSARAAIYTGYKTKAKLYNRSFTITLQEFFDLSKSNCFYCGKQPSATHNKNMHGVSTCICKYTGLDRVDSAKDYSLDNLVPCCHRCNSAKNNMTLEEFKGWVGAVYSNFYLKSQSINASLTIQSPNLRSISARPEEVVPADATKLVEKLE